MAQLTQASGMSFIPLDFDPKATFGKVRAPVVVRINGHTYRSTIAMMGGVACIPLRRSQREAAGLGGTERVEVTLTLDTQPREVNVPPDLAAALAADEAAQQAWSSLSYTAQREVVDALASAKRPDTRARRLAAALSKLSQRPA